VFFAVGVATLMFGFKLAGASVAAGVVATALMIPTTTVTPLSSGSLRATSTAAGFDRP
jgi:hypothetical protein